MSERVDIHLGKRLRSRRRALGLTQQDLGTALGIRFQQIQKYECAANRMSAACLWKLAKALEVDVRYFFEGLTEVNPAPQPDLGAILNTAQPAFRSPVQGLWAPGPEPRPRSA